MSAPYTFLRPVRATREVYASELTAPDSPISLTHIGASLMSTPLDMYRIGTGERFILYVGAHHGTDWMTSCFLYRFLFDMARAIEERRFLGGVDPLFFFSKYSLFVLPMLNVDGCELCMTGEPLPPLEERQRRMKGDEGFSSWQANARGVDLCHNYAYAHATYKAQEAASHIEAGPRFYSGEYPESEPEVHALATFVRTLMPKGIVSLRLGEGSVYASPGDSPVPRRVATRLAQVLGIPQRPWEGLTAGGSLCAYTGEGLGIPSFTVCMEGGENPTSDATASARYPRIHAALARFPLFL